ncbi:hypothetical protein ACS0TY_010279 [Phlomoides rotata]
MECAKVAAGVRKAKKKVKDELDRIKQAEKKKKRLEKALASSLAIRSQLEKKKLKKKEEQERLDEESAAIAEAVAMQVLLGEDPDDLSKIILKKDEGLSLWDRTTNIVTRDSYGHHNGRMWNLKEKSRLMRSPAYAYLGSGLYPQYFGQDVWGPDGLCVGQFAAQTVSSLKIADEECEDAFVFNVS